LCCDVVLYEYALLLSVFVSGDKCREVTTKVVLMQAEIYQCSYTVWQLSGERMAAEGPMGQCLKRFRIEKVWFHSTHYCAASSLRVPVVVIQLVRLEQLFLYSKGSLPTLLPNPNSTMEDGQMNLFDIDLSDNIVTGRLLEALFQINVQSG
jgi:hypothetical protein